MNNPALTISATGQCCVLDENGHQCPQKAKFYVGTNGLDGYTYVCGDHVEAVKRDDDKVMEL